MAKTIRTRFVKDFDEQTAVAIEQAAAYHSDAFYPNQNKGSDPFRWALLMCIGFECMKIEQYRSYHGITPPWQKLNAWIIKYGNFAKHDGGCDTLAALAGAYQDYIPNNK